MGKKTKLKSAAPLPSALTVAPMKPSQLNTEIAKPSNIRGTVETRIPGPGTKSKRPPVRAIPAPAVLSKLAAEASLPNGKALERHSADRIDVHFVVLEPDARRVSLCGAFNGWSPEATPMIPQGDGHWKATVALPPGRHEYKLVVNGEWRPDLHSPEHVLNEFGTLNSVVVVAGCRTTQGSGCS